MKNVFSKIVPTNSSTPYFVKNLYKSQRIASVDSSVLFEHIKNKEKKAKCDPDIYKAYCIRNIQSKTPQEITKSLAFHISKLLDSKKEVSITALESLANGINNILQSNSIPDFSYELKILSKGVLQLITNDINKINNKSIKSLKDKYQKLYASANEIKQKLSGTSIGYENPKFKIDKNANPILQSDYYYKSQDGEQYKTKHSPKELFNFMNSFKAIALFYETINILNENDIDVTYGIENGKVDYAKQKDLKLKPSNLFEKKIYSQAKQLFNKTISKQQFYKCKQKVYESCTDEINKSDCKTSITFFTQLKNIIDENCKIIKINNALSELENLLNGIERKYLKQLTQSEKTPLPEEQITDIDKFIVDFQNASGSKNSHIKKEGNYLILFEYGKNKEQVRIDISQPDTQTKVLELLNNIKNKLCKDNGNTYATLLHIAHRILLRAPLGQTITNITKENIEEANKLIQNIEELLKQISESSIATVDIQEYEINNKKYYLVLNIDCEAGKYNHQTFNIFYKKNNEVYNLNINPNVGIMTFINIEEKNASKLAPYIKNKLDIN